MRPQDTALETVRDLVIREQVKSGIPSIAIGVAREGEILWEEAFGWADRARRIPADEHTPYSLASITKSMTGTALMQLVEQGKVDLDAPIENYLGGAKLRPYREDAPPVTVRQIANHSAGLPLHYQFFYTDEPHERPPMAETLRRYGVLITPPGERMQYSNLGYGILDHLITTVAGRPWADQLRAQVFVPLGMHRSAVGLTDELRPFAAARYGLDGVAYPDYDFDHPGGSAVYASVHDLLRFAMANLDTLLPDQKQVLSEASRRELHSPTATGSGIGGYGVGWVTNEDEGGYATLGHSGGMGGAATQMTLVPSEGIAVVTLVNQTMGILAPHARVEALAALLPKYAERKNDVYAELLKRGVPAGEPLGEEQWSALAGTWEGEVEVYSGDLALEVSFDADAKLALARLGNAPRVVIDHLRQDGDRLLGAMVGSVGSPDTARYPHGLVVDVQQRGEAIDGALIAVALPTGAIDEGGAKGRRAGNALAHRVRLGKVGR